MRSTMRWARGSTRCRSRPRRCSRHCGRRRKASPGGSAQTVSPRSRGPSPPACRRRGKAGTERLCRPPRSERLSGTRQPGGTMPSSLVRLIPLLIALLTAPRTLPIIETGTIAGHVRDATSGRPIAGAVVEVGGTRMSTMTRDSGQFVIPNVPVGTYTVRAKMIGYRAAEATGVRVTANATVSLALTLIQDPIKLDAVVVTGTPVSVERRAVMSSVGTVVALGTTSEMDGYAGARTRRYDSTAAWRYAHPPVDREQYDEIVENQFIAVAADPLSTFSIDVDRASYSNMRRFIMQDGQLPPRDAIRIEELVNYFPYSYSEPQGDDPIAINAEVAPAPWKMQHQLVRIGLQARRVKLENLPQSNFVFLLDVSGSMDEEDKLPLVQAAMRLLVNQLRPQDRVAIVVYAGAAGLVLPSTPGNQKDKILDAIDRLRAGGSTAGGAGIRRAYDEAVANFIRGGNNRVILATDGDFNVGASSDAEMVQLIEEKRKTGVFLTVLGVGEGNLQAAKMEKLADHGNGNYAYIDTISEAQKVLVHELGGTLYTVAKDVKIQVEWNPARVQAYRLIGYENRLLHNEDFTDDKKDAGEVGAGHSVTALYEG